MNVFAVIAGRRPASEARNERAAEARRMLLEISAKSDYPMMHLISVCDHTFQREQDIPAFSSCEHQYWKDSQGDWLDMQSDPWTFLQGKVENATGTDRGFAAFSLGLLTCAENYGDDPFSDALSWFAASAKALEGQTEQFPLGILVLGVVISAQIQVQQQALGSAPEATWRDNIGSISEPVCEAIVWNRAVPIRKLAPEYPKHLLKPGRSEGFTLRLALDSQGLVQSVSLVESPDAKEDGRPPHKKFLKEASTVLSRYRYLPACVDGRPVPTTVEHDVYFWAQEVRGSSPGRHRGAVSVYERVEQGTANE
ncbi:MAG: hypothetical protein AAF184_23980 [Pseudomonadota bacterium]